MTQTEEDQAAMFSRQLEVMFAEESPGLRDSGFEAQVLRRILRRRRLRTVVLGVGAMTGVLIAVRTLTESRLPALPVVSFPDLLAGNSPIGLLYAGLGGGGFAPVVIAGGLTLMGLAFARILEEV